VHLPFVWVSLSSREYSLEVVFDHVKQLWARLISGYPVRLAGIQHEPERLAGVDERVDHLNGALHVHVVITGTVHLQHLAVQVGGKVYWLAFLVTFSFSFGRPM